MKYEWDNRTGKLVEQPRGMQSAAGSLILLAMLIVSALLFLNAAITMMLFNLIHYHVEALHAVPAFGYWDSFVLTAVIGWVGFLFKGIDFNAGSK